MKKKKNIVKLYFILSIGVGILIGSIFPFFTHFFLGFENLNNFISFSIICILAGILVGVISYLVCHFTILAFINNIRLSLKKIANKEENIETLDDMYTDDRLGDIVRYLNRIIVHNQKTIDFFKDQYGKRKNLTSSMASTNKNALELVEKVKNEITGVKVKLQEEDDQLFAISNSQIEINESANGVVENINAQSSSITETSSIIEEVIIQIKNISTSALEKKKDIAKLSGELKGGTSELFETLKSIKNISFEAESITDIITQIKKIASQTNILAMNAAIEAAHAGEAGKGFTVVSQEVQRLADATRESSDQIAVILKETLGKINESVQNTSRTEKTISDIFTSFIDITNRINVMIDELSEISEKAAAMQVTLNSLIKITIDVNQSSTSMVDRSLEIEKSLGVLANLSDDNLTSFSKVNEQVTELVQIMLIMKNMSDENLNMDSRLDEKKDILEKSLI